MVAKDDEVAVATRAKLRVDERGHHLGPGTKTSSGRQPRLVGSSLDLHAGSYEVAEGRRADLDPQVAAVHDRD